MSSKGPITPKAGIGATSRHLKTHQQPIAVLNHRQRVPPPHVQSAAGLARDPLTHSAALRAGFARDDKRHDTPHRHAMREVSDQKVKFAYGSKVPMPAPPESPVNAPPVIPSTTKQTLLAAIFQFSSSEELTRLPVRILFTPVTTTPS